MKKLLLIRHGSTELNEAGRFQGVTDAPLSDRGRRQARSLRGRLPGPIPGAGKIWTSDLNRARRTATLVFPDRPRKVDVRLRELDFGAFEGGTYAENRALHGEVFRRWVRAPEAGAPPEGESLADFRDRIRAWITEVAGDPEVVAVTHGGPIRMILTLLTGVGFRRLRGVAIPPATAIGIGRSGGRWKITAPPDLGVVRDETEDGDLEELRRILEEG